MFRLVSIALLAISSQALKLQQPKTLAEVSASQDEEPNVALIHEWFDSNANGKVTMKEWLNGLTIIAGKKKYKYTDKDTKVAKSIFEAIDTDNNGITL